MAVGIITEILDGIGNGLLPRIEKRITVVGNDLGCDYLFDHEVKRMDQQKGEVNLINKLCKQAYETAKSKGWHDTPRETGTILALIHSEVSEALEADRKGNQEGFVEELADVCIRVFDLAGLMNIDLEKAILDKMEFNRSRPMMHGGKKY